LSKQKASVVVEDVLKFQIVLADPFTTQVEEEKVEVDTDPKRSQVKKHFERLLEEHDVDFMKEYIEKLKNSKNTKGKNNPNNNNSRVTPNPSLIKQTTKVMDLVSGRKKTDAVQSQISEGEDIISKRRGTDDKNKIFLKQNKEPKLETKS